jgi:hypothetical protein
MVKTQLNRFNITNGIFKSQVENAKRASDTPFCGGILWKTMHLVRTPDGFRSDQAISKIYGKNEEVGMALPKGLPRIGRSHRALVVQCEQRP